METKNSNNSIMMKIASFVVDRRNFIFFFLIAICIFCAFSRNWVDVENDITKYLPENTETRRGLTIMEDNFTTFATAEVLVENVTLDRAEELCREIEYTKGVKSVEFDGTEDHFKNATALINITFDGLDNDEVSIDSLAEVKEKLAKYDAYVVTEVGNPLKEIVNSEMLIVDIIAVIIVVTVLIFTSKTYAEIPVLLMTFGCAAILNMGTNYIFGTISFVTDSIAIVLQLALAIDYAIILLHRYQEEHASLPAREAAIVALSKAIPEISASSLTTVAGLAAMCLMEFRLGPDMGVVLIKAILLSLFSVFFLMPGLLVVFANWIDRTPHKNFVPKIDFLGKAVYVTRFIMPFLFVGVLIAGCIFSHRVEYAYTEDSVSCYRNNEMQIAEDKITAMFGHDNMLAVIVPSGNYVTEKKLISELESLNHTKSVLGLANVEAKDGYCIADALTPRQFSELSGLDFEVCEALYLAYSINAEDYGHAVTSIDSYSVPLIDMFDYLVQKEKEVSITLNDDTRETLNELEGQLNDARAQLNNNGWTRMVLMSDIPTESQESFNYLNVVHGVIGKYYDESYVIGDTTSCRDLKTSFETDNILITILTIFFVMLVLVFTFKSLGLPVLLIMIIQGSIWVNFSIPFLQGSMLFFMTYLIISSIQMGANIDYAIVISSRYMELKQQMPLKEAMVETLNLAFPTIITSGTMLASAGFIIGYLTSEKTIATIGMYLGQGTLISIFLVMCVLPQILLLGDIIIRKTSFNIPNPIQTQQKSGTMRINGRVRGNLSGTFEGEINGIFRGDLNAIVSFGNVEELDEDE